MIRRFAVLSLVVAALCVNGANAGDEYYVLGFGQQRIPNDPNKCHTFATFVQARWPGDGPCPSNAIVEEHTISWLAANGNCRIQALLPECGRNFGMHETMEWAQQNEMRTSMWGPYRCCPDLYCRALKHLRMLESGSVRYKALDSGRDSDNVSNCIHAASSVADGMRLRIASPGWGEMASYAVLKKYRPWILDREPTPWVATALNLDQYPIIHRDWQSPQSGFFGPVYRALGGERDLQATYGP